jgi:hypothetical protein
MTPSQAPPPASELEPLVEMARAAIAREYPYHLTLVLASDADLGLPRTLTPAFAGSFDWHSAVHGHWTLARALFLHPRAPWAERARESLAVSLTAAHLQAEHAFLAALGREGWERPYGLAWLLQLAAELRAWDDPDARRWSESLAPLESLASYRLLAWLEKLPWPVRSGEHSQSAFALGLLLDWARASGRREEAARVVARVVSLYGEDRAAPVRYEPSGHDFLSPALAEADLMRRCLGPSEYAGWLTGFLPAAGSPELARWLVPVVSPDRADGKLAHLDGLNLSRAWMLDGVVSALRGGHPLARPLAAASIAHRDAGLASLAGGHWMGTHWLASYAMYLGTRRGIA